ncbi:hypothetical protein YC2023_025652 [Brassica napus]
MCLLPAMNSLAATIPVKTISELSFATQIVHVVIAGNAVEFFHKLDRYLYLYTASIIAS